MIFKNIRVDELKNKELADCVRKLRNLTDGGYDLYDKNDAAITRLLKRALKLAKEEKEWYLYFDGLFDILYQYQRSGNHRQVVKYAEVFYQDSEQHMDRVLPRYAGTNLAPLNTWTYDMIYDAYEEYHQINDAKLDAFMKRYEENALKYGKAYCYYDDEISLAILYRDKEMAEHGRRYFEKYEKEMLSCYVCGHKTMLGYYLLKDRRERTEEMMLDFINHNIPKQHLWCYKYCESAQARNMYFSVLKYCIDLGRVEDFRYFYEKYWKKQPKADWHQKEGVGWQSFSAYLCAVAGNFDALEADMRCAAEDIQEQAKYGTVTNMADGLEWYCYFTLLERSGVGEVEIGLPEEELEEIRELEESGMPEASGMLAGNGMPAEIGKLGEMPEVGSSWKAEKNGGRNEGGQPAEDTGSNRVSCRALSRYMERMADGYGMKFHKARKKFDYPSVKKAYLECAGLAGAGDEEEGA